MADCERLPGCPFFNDKMEAPPATVKWMKTYYCRGDNTKCARHMVLTKLGKPAVPSDLYPNDRERAVDILKGK